jgi:hypothetical protein
MRDQVAVGKHSIVLQLRSITAASNPFLAPTSTPAHIAEFDARVKGPMPNMGLRSATVPSMASSQQADRSLQNAAARAEAVRLQRLRNDAERPMSVNLAEGIALSHQLLRFTGAARRI